MPDAAGFITHQEAKRIRRLAQSGFSVRDIAAMVGCCEDAARRHSGSYSARLSRAQRYERIVTQAAAYVPTFGGGR